MQSSNNSGRDGVCLTKGVRPSSAALCQPAGPALGPLSQAMVMVKLTRSTHLMPSLCCALYSIVYLCGTAPFCTLLTGRRLNPPRAIFKAQTGGSQYVSTDQSGAHLLILYFGLCDGHCQILLRDRRSFVSPRDQITILGNHSLADSLSVDERGGRSRCLKNRFF